jgi:hypothetical protein
VLSAASIAVTVTGIVTVLAARALLDQDAGLVGGTDPDTVRANQVLLVITVTLVTLAAAPGLHRPAHRRPAFLACADGLQ